jgi:hypothetical protein
MPSSSQFICSADSSLGSVRVNGSLALLYAPQCSICISAPTFSSMFL